MDNPYSEAALIHWFREALEAAGIDGDWEQQPLSYDAMNPYDFLCLSLIRQAERTWRLKYGFAPTPGQLHKALGAAQFDLARSRRQQRLPWLRRLLGRP